MRGGWQPVLEGIDAERARDAVAAIAADLDRVGIDDPSLGAGQAGIALLHVYRARAGVDGAAAQAEQALDRALAAIDARATASLFAGLPGVGWVMQHAGDQLDCAPDALADLDAAVFRLLEGWRSDLGYELLHGLVGIGVYALERLPDSAAARAVDRVVDLLAEWAERTADGATWRSPPDGPNLRDEERPDNPAGCVVLGIAHGMAGVLGFLAGAHAARPGAADTRELLADGVHWLLAQESRGGERCYPMRVGTRLRPIPWTDGWCHGEPGLACVLVRAGLAADESSWIATGRELAVLAAARALDGDDLSFCHGTLGRAHLYNRIAQATGDQRLREAAVAGYRQVLDRRRPGQGIGGYPVVDAFGGSPTSLARGAAGIALGLLAAVSAVEPAWDRLFLIQPPAGAAVQRPSATR
jgi:class I lanthipeptide synthase